MWSYLSYAAVSLNRHKLDYFFFFLVLALRPLSSTFSAQKKIIMWKIMLHIHISRC